MPVDEGSIDIEHRIVTKDDTQQGLTQAQSRAELLQSRYIVLAQSIQTLASAFMQLQFAQERQLIVQDMLMNAQDRLANAQDRYNMALNKYGGASREAIQAHRELEMAQNQLERTTTRANMLLQRQFLEIIPTGISVMTALVSLTWALGGAESARSGIGGFLKFAALAAVAGGFGVAAGMSMAGGKVMHSGGVVPESGYYMLERGETVNAQRGGSGGGSVGGGDRFHVSIINQPAHADVQKLYYEISYQNEQEKRRRIAQSDRSY